MIVVSAVYENGQFIPANKPDNLTNGEQVKLVLLEAGNAAKKDAFFGFVEKHSFPLPGNYTFHREESHRL